MNLLTGVPFAADLVIFVVCAVVIWVAGVRLSNSTDVLSDRLHLGSALGGLILLAVATNLPELAITVSAAAANQLDVAVSNILGGIAIQTVVLVALDAFGVRARRPLTYQAASLRLVIEGAFVIAVLVAVVMGTQLPKTLVHFRLSPDVVLIAVLWVGGLLLTRRAGRLPWADNGNAPDSSPSPAGTRRKSTPTTPANRGSAPAGPHSPSASRRWPSWSPGTSSRKAGARPPTMSGCPGCCSAPPSSPPRPACRSCRPG